MGDSYLRQLGHLVRVRREETLNPLGRRMFDMVIVAEISELRDLGRQDEIAMILHPSEHKPT